MLKITEMYAFVAENEDGEGVMGFKVSDGWIPMVGADMARIKSLYPVALRISEVSNKDFKILRFTRREDITEKYKNEKS